MGHDYSNDTKCRWIIGVLSSLCQQSIMGFSVVLGQGALGFAMSSSGSICITYAIDSYPKVASEGIVLMLFIRNMMGMGFSYAILPWINRNGLVVVTWLMFMLSIIINGSFIVMLVFGKRFRRWTAAHYEKVSEPRYGEFFKR